MPAILARFILDGAIRKTTVLQVNDEQETFVELYNREMAQEQDGPKTYLNNIVAFGVGVNNIRAQAPVTYSHQVLKVCFDTTLFPGGQPNIEFREGVFDDKEQAEGKHASAVVQSRSYSPEPVENGEIREVSSKVLPISERRAAHAKRLQARQEAEAAIAAGQNVSMSVSASTFPQQQQQSNQHQPLTKGPHLAFSFGPKAYKCLSEYFTGSYELYQQFTTARYQLSTSSSHNNHESQMSNIPFDHKLNEDLYESEYPTMEDPLMGFQSENACVFTAKVDGAHLHPSILVHLDSSGLYTRLKSTKTGHTNGLNQETDQFRVILFRNSEYLTDDLQRFVKRYDKTEYKAGKLQVISANQEQKLLFGLLFRKKEPIITPPLVGVSEGLSPSGSGSSNSFSSSPALPKFAPPILTVPAASSISAIASNNNHSLPTAPPVDMHGAALARHPTIQQQLQQQQPLSSYGAAVVATTSDSSPPPPPARHAPPHSQMQSQQIVSASQGPVMHVHAPVSVVNNPNLNIPSVSASVSSMAYGSSALSANSGNNPHVVHSLASVPPKLAIPPSSGSGKSGSSGAPSLSMPMKESPKSSDREKPRPPKRKHNPPGPIKGDKISYAMCRLGDMIDAQGGKVGSNKIGKKFRGVMEGAITLYQCWWRLVSCGVVH